MPPLSANQKWRRSDDMGGTGGRMTDMEDPISTISDDEQSSAPPETSAK